MGSIIEELIQREDILKNLPDDLILDLINMLLETLEKRGIPREQSLEVIINTDMN